MFVKRVHASLASMLILLLLAGVHITSSSMQAQERAALPSAGESSTSFSSIDLQRFVESALAEQITVQEAKATYDKLSKQQQAMVQDIVESKKRAFKPKQAREQHDAPQDQLTTAAAYLWQQFIENAWYPGQPAGSAYASRYSTTVYNCDSDPDTDYVFYFVYNSSNPDALRWSTNSSQVYAATGFGKSLNGYGNSYREVNLCMGDNTVWLAGGADWVKSSIIINNN